MAMQDIQRAATLVKWFPIQQLGDAITYTEERHGRVPAVYVKNTRDNTMNLRAQNFVVENYGPFKEVVEFDGGHFSAWSHADEFVQFVLLLADKYK